jgi:predicted AAA+ superfamily ATPase
MKRLIDHDLQEWKMNPRRKALLLRGARQVGKTYAVRNLGKSFENFIEINFERQKEVHIFFEGDLDPKKIVQSLSLFTRQPIIPGKTLLFLDEIQALPRVIIALRYFYELMPELHVIAAGSLLDFAIEAVGIPVGRIESLYVYPLSFIEFLLAQKGGEIVVQEIFRHPVQERMSEPIHEKFLELVSNYVAIGGMPEAVKLWIDYNDPLKCAHAHTALIEAYRQDFHSYAKKHQIKYVDLLFDEVPRQLEKQFQYSKIEGDFRKRELAPCMDLLEKAGVVHRIYRTAANGIPLGAEVSFNHFKAILLDVALSQALLGLEMHPLFLYPIKELTNRGGIAEAFVGQELLAYSTSYKKAHLYYWERAERTSQAEVDYLVQDNQNIIPIEVKSGAGSTLLSMHTFLNSHPKSPHGIRFSTQNYSVYEKIHSYPLYAIVKAIPGFADVAKKIL